MMTTTTVALEKKAQEINLVLSEPDIDLWKLRELALTEGGLVNDTLRKRAWPRLVGIHDLYTVPPALAATSVAAAVARSPARGRSESRRDLLPPRPSSKKGLRLPSRKKRKERRRSSAKDRLLPPPSPTIAPSVPPRDDASSGAEEEEGDEHFVLVGSDADEKHGVDAMALQSMDAGQIARDTARSTWHLLTGNQRSQRIQMEHKRKKRVSSLLRRKQNRLGNLLNLTLVRTYPRAADISDRLRYYQGFHDVASICMAVLSGGSSVGSDEVTLGGGAATSTSVSDDAEAAVTASKRMGLDVSCKVLGQVGGCHFRDAMRPDFLLLQTALKLTVFPLLAVLDPQVHDFLWMCGMEPFFCLPWILTWFSHDVRDTQLVKRLFDAFLVSHPLLPLYMSIAIVCHPYNRLELLQTECDFAAVHQCLAGLPKNSNRVGWKYRPGDGYVSCEEGEEDEDAETLSTSGLSSTVPGDEWVDPPKVLQAASHDDASTSETHSLVSSIGSSLRGNDPVPFQDILDHAIDYMRRIPPRQILGLAERYYDPESLAPMMEQATRIAFFSSSLPPWATASFTPADWVLKQRARKSRGMKKSSRRDRKRSRSRSRTRSASLTRQSSDDEASGASPASSNSGLLRRSSLLVGTAGTPTTTTEKSTTDSTTTPLSPTEYIELHKDSLAVLACGLGVGEDELRRQKRRKRRRKLVIALGAVVLVACTAAFVVTTYDNGRLLMMQRRSDEVVEPGGGGATQERQLTGAVESPLNVSTGTISAAEIIAVELDATGGITATQRVERSGGGMMTSRTATKSSSPKGAGTTSSVPKRAAAVAKKAAAQAATAMASTLQNATNMAATAMASVTSTTTSTTTSQGTTSSPSASGTSTSSGRTTSSTRSVARGTTSTPQKIVPKPRSGGSTSKPVMSDYVKQAFDYAGDALWDNVGF